MYPRHHSAHTALTTAQAHHTDASILNLHQQQRLDKCINRTTTDLLLLASKAVHPDGPTILNSSS